MEYTSINIQGNILSSEILDKIRLDDAKFQGPEAFGLSKEASIRDEIGMAWSIVRSHWTTYKKRLETLPKNDTGTSLTREKWILPLLTELGYELAFVRKEIVINDKAYAISHQAVNRGNFPVLVMGYNDDLDKRRESGGPKQSPHSLVQEYLNHTEHLYALITNGKQLRLLRDATRLVRLSYLEFDLEKIMEEELYADFALLFRVLHASRMPADQSQGEDAIIEHYHQDSLASGTRIREKLSAAVEQSIQTLANGFLQRHTNEALHKQFENKSIDAHDYYLYLLRLIYRILFVIVIEERKLIYPDKQDEQLSKLRKIYFQYYSLERIRKLVERNAYVDEDKIDLWKGLITTFTLFENQQYGKKLGIDPLGSGLFSPSAIGMLPDLELNNKELLSVIRNLTTFENEQGQIVRVNYSDLDVEEFGSVYEGLLEYDPKVEYTGGQWHFTFVEGDGRSSSGSHYTPEELVKPLIKHSLDYVIKDKLVKCEEQKANGDWYSIQKEAPSITGYLYNLVINQIIKYENLSGYDNLAIGNGNRHRSISINKLLSQGGNVWDDFSAPQVISLNSGQHIRGMGSKQSEGVQQLSKDSQRQSEGDRDSPNTQSESRALSGKPDSVNTPTIRYTWKADTQHAEVTLEQEQLQIIWQLTSESARLSLLATHHLLSIRVCDVACGSGHILLSAARRIATELACYREQAEQPSPPYFRAAIRDVIKTCIYGVDLNPLAVELCKVALWLEAHNPGEPLNFLDHHIKCGNAIVGLAHMDELRNGIPNEAFKSLPGDDKDIASELRRQNDKERKNRVAKAQYAQIVDKLSKENLQSILSQLDLLYQMPETTPEEITEKAAAYYRLLKSKSWWRLKQLADIQVAQFFIQKGNTSNLVTEGTYYQYLINDQAIQSTAAAKATGVSSTKRFFHWFLEFPEVMNKGGFDTILGNPPFLGGLKLSTNYGLEFLNFIHTSYPPAKGTADLVTYFFRRNYDLIRSKGFISLISTNTIAQGGSREGGLAYLLSNGATINHAVRSMKWPGFAAVEVALVTVCKGQWTGNFILDQKSVDYISSYLDSQDNLGEPQVLKANENKSFVGSYILGKGFILTPEEAQSLIAKDPKNKDVLFPYLNGDDLNNRVDQSPSRWVINFFDWPEKRYSQDEWKELSSTRREEINERLQDEKFVPIAPPWYGGQVAMDYQDCYRIVEETVKPERQRWKQDSNGNDIVGTYALRKPLPENWWIYGEKRPGLYKTIAPLERVLTVALTSKTVAFAFSKRETVFSHATGEFALDDDASFSIIQSTYHNNWAWKYASSMKGDLRYTPSDVFENYPFPLEKSTLPEEIGKKYYDFRSILMQSLQLGLTKTYNHFHNQELSPNIEYLTAKDFQKKYGQETWNLYKHLEIDKVGKIGYTDALEKIMELRRLHKEMDEAVLTAYGWHEDSEKWGKAIRLRHDFYEVDYLPENDRTRYTIHPEARKEVLKRLLLLNHERWEEEARQGLHDKATVEKFYAEKGVPIPADVAIHFEKGAKTLAKKKDKEATTVQQPVAPKSKKVAPNQGSLYAPEEMVKKAPEVNIFSCVTLLNHSDQSQVKFRIVANPNDRQLTIGYDNRPLTDQLCLQVLNRKVGYKFELSGVKYEILNVE